MSIDQLNHVVSYYRRKLETVALMATTLSQVSFPCAKPIVQNKEDYQPSPSSLTHLHPGKKLVIDEDFRTPTPKPRSIFTKKLTSN